MTAEKIMPIDTENTENTDDREPTAWRKSSYSNDRGNCVEMARRAGGGIAFRDSKDPHGPCLTFTSEQVKAFLCAITCKDGDAALRTGRPESD